MSARPRPAGALALLLLPALLAAPGCERHRFGDAGHVTVGDEWRDAAPRIRPGPPEQRVAATPPQGLPLENPYAGNLRAIQEGRRLYRWMNCDGCHAEGGGSIGPALWDDQWRYGGRGIDLAESILDGRPDGMPAFRDHLPVQEVWKLVAYVQSLEPRGGYYRAGVK